MRESPPGALVYPWTAPPELETAILAGRNVRVFYVHLPLGADIERSGGSAAHQAFLTHAVAGVQGFLADLGRPFGIHPWPVDDLVLWIGEEDAESTPGDSLETWLLASLRDTLTKFCGGLSAPQLDNVCIVGRRIPAPTGTDPLRCFAEALRDAQLGALDPAAREHERSTALMDRALRERAFIFHYQPIVDVARGRVLAHEALCRGTLDDLRFPDVIFSTAERTQRIWELGRVLRDLIAGALDLWQTTSDAEPMMFINVHPLDIDDPLFLEQALSGALSRHANRVVVELTERAAIQDYRRVKEFFATLRQRGYRLAIDDLGSGYAGLTALAELEPDFIKFDMGLIRDLHLHPIKRRLIERMHGFAKEIGAETISEGVEVPEERDALIDTGCNLMQGYYFARPSPKFSEVPADRFASSPAPPTPRVRANG